MSDSITSKMVDALKKRYVGRFLRYETHFRCYKIIDIFYDPKDDYFHVLIKYVWWYKPYHHSIYCHKLLHEMCRYFGISIINIIILTK
jgi:hypothetical protein